VFINLGKAFDVKNYSNCGGILVNHFRAILVFGLVGFLGAILFNKTITNRYEATLIMKMIEVYDHLGALNKVEEPTLLITRLKQPSTYTQKEVDSCFSANAKFPHEELVSKVNATLVGRLDSVVQLKIRGPTKELAAQCGQAIYEMITDQQLRIKADRDNLNSILLLNYRKQYKELSSLDGLEHKTDRLLFLLEKISILDFSNVVGQNQVAVISPIYISENRLLLKRGIILVIGFLVGSFLGWIVLNGMQIWKIYIVEKYKYYF
jgi:hypothetical protein